MSQLQIIRASAGSGKTYSLTEEYLKILINEPVRYFKKILAVTFTNKATAEMKSRILKELHLLATQQPSNHLQALINASENNELTIRKKANEVLNQILHGYSWFRVETIDTFFQGIIRSFIRELNIPGNYTIELDQDKILFEAIDNLLDKLDTDPTMLNWVLEYIDTKLSEEKSWLINNELQTLGKALFRENLIEKMPLIQDLIQNNNFLKVYRDTLYAITQSYEKSITTLSDSILQSIKEHNFNAKDFFYSGSGTISYIDSLSNKVFELPKSRIETVLNNPEKWAAKSSLRIPEIIAFGTNTINPAIRQIKAIIEKDGSDYNTAKSILSNIHILGLLSGLSKEIAAIRHEKSLFLISDTSPFIHKIINNNDTPFIYEKAGNHFNHLLIDEFQDTSSMQWGNFKPLIENSLSKGKACLLVGDVKQSIYRWRSSNWEILESQVKKEFPSYYTDKILKTNWRSNGLIIRFNNLFFETAAKFIESILPINNHNLIPPSDIYKDVAQNIPEHKSITDGYINIKIFSKDDTKDNESYYGDELVERINEALSKGYKPGDIALLVRGKKEGSLIANYIVDASKEKKFICEVGVISNESLFLNSSSVVQLLLSCMQFIYTPTDKIVAAAVLANYRQIKRGTENIEIDFPSGSFDIKLLNTLIEPEFIEQCNQLRLESLYLLTEKLTKLLRLHENDSELVYLHSFLDIIFDYGSSERSDLGGFLNYWKEEGGRKSISAAETSGSVRILTIHKSKGLEFPIVILPFCNWSLFPMANEKLWLEPTEEPYKKLPFLPINYSKILDNSIFKKDFENENYLTLIDNLNLLYVAFTRAENALFVFATDTNKELNAANKLLTTTLDTLSNNSTLHIITSEDQQRYIIGKISSKEKTEKTSKEIILSGGASSTTLPKVRISSEALNYMTNAEQKTDHAAYGRILHGIMEHVITRSDIANAVKKVVEEGIFTEEQGKATEVFLQKVISSKETASWFDEKYTVLTESDIIIPGGPIKRPDRIMLSTNETIIIDYKFGEEEEAKHLKQVEEYIDLLKEMDFKNVKGFVWYVQHDKVVEV
jgi:ATP-dependent exoDNAse (exonuclease V) beta subunit